MNPLALVPETTTHPLEPLNAAEVAAAAAILKAERELDDNWRFVFIMLHEPPKDAV
ncbi:MAG: tyramine oxidase, partial [Conexibacter sp.]|nr:tyramine oxidase [Conexibacter sp.]